MLGVARVELRPLGPGLCGSERGLRPPGTAHAVSGIRKMSRAAFREDLFIFAKNRLRIFRGPWGGRPRGPKRAGRPPWPPKSPGCPRRFVAKIRIIFVKTRSGHPADSRDCGGAANDSDSPSRMRAVPQLGCHWAPWLPYPQGQVHPPTALRAFAELSTVV